MVLESIYSQYLGFFKHKNVAYTGSDVMNLVDAEDGLHIKVYRLHLFTDFSGAAYKLRSGNSSDFLKLMPTPDFKGVSCLDSRLPFVQTNLGEALTLQCSDAIPASVYLQYKVEA